MYTYKAKIDCSFGTTLISGTNAVNYCGHVVHSPDTFRAREPGVDFQTHSFLPLVPFGPRSGLSEMEQDLVPRQDLARRL